jgi:hypothetical protein
MTKQCHRKECSKNHCNSCRNRDYLSKPECLKYKLALSNKCNGCKNKPVSQNSEEKKYSNYHYNGLYHKAFYHDPTTGSLVNSNEYAQFRNAILDNNQQSASATPLAPGFTIKQSDPLASLATLLIGSPQCNIHINNPPTLSSAAGAAEMVELYSHMLARDVPFSDYNLGNSIINNILVSPGYLTQPNVLNSLPDYTPVGSIDVKTLFRGIGVGEQVGPYISQFLYLNVPMGGLTLPQIYNAPPTKAYCLLNSLVNEWGRNRAEMINMQNTTITGFPATPTQNSAYIHDGRSLSEAVHADYICQFFLQTGLILSGLGVSTNTGFPVYPNMGSFCTDAGSASLQGTLGHISNESLKHAWYRKWQIHRKQRPEAFSLQIDNVQNTIVSNINNYDISSVILNNPILPVVETYNAQWGSPAFDNSFLLTTAFREGSPTHPAYPSGHAVIAGACITILKMFFNADQSWSAVNMNNTRINPISPQQYVQSDSTGANLIPYTDGDNVEMTICGELNKLASNISIGRNWAGIHYRTDAIQGILLGEQVAIRYMEDMLSSYVQNNLNKTVPTIKFTNYKGHTVTVRPTVCE